MKRFLLLIIISHILMVRLCGQDSITPAAKAKQVSPLKKEAQVNIDKYIDKSLRDAIDYLDLFLGNVYAPAQNPFFVDLNSFIAGFGAKPGEQRKMLNLFNPLISNELAEYAEKYDNDTIYANESIKKFKMDSIWKRVDSLGLVTFEEYWNWSKKNITSFFAMVSVSTDNSILQQRSDLKRDHRYKNRYTCTFKAYLYRDGGGFMNGTNFSIQAPAIDIPLDFKIALNIDKNKTPSGFAIEEIRLARYIWVDTVPSRNFRINANFQGGYSSAKIDLDKPGIEGSYTGPGNGYSAEFSIDVELLKQQAKPQMIIPGFMLGIGYQSTTFNYFLNGFQEKQDMIDQPPVNLINLVKYNLVTDFNDIDQQTTVNSFFVPLGLKLTYYLDTNRSIGLKCGLGMLMQFPMSINTTTRSGQATYSAECTFADNKGNYVDVTLDDDLLGYKSVNTEISNEDPTKLLSGINGFYSIGLAFTPGIAKRFGGFVQFSNSIPIRDFEFQLDKSDNGKLRKLGTGMNGQTENLLHFSNSFGLRNSIIQAGFFIKILSETR